MHKNTRANLSPTFHREIQLNQNGFKAIVGVDEVGRGPWAGPVTTAAVMIDPCLYHEYENNGSNAFFTEIHDSKKLTAKNREKLYERLTSTPGILYAIAEASVEEIDQLNILGATFLAMKRAVAALPQVPDYVLVDGNRSPGFECRSEPIVQGDQKCLSIAAASILAKVTRDRLMSELAISHPGYGWESNVGYGTQKHQEGLKMYGVTAHHRKSFTPISDQLARQNNMKQ